MSDASSLPSRVVILGATGPTGFHLAAALRKRDTAVRVVSRSREGLERSFGSTGEDIFPADALNERDLAAAIEGFPLVYDCIGLPADKMYEHPETARRLTAAAQSAGARIVHVPSFWAYLPLQKSPLNESHPRQGGCDWVQYRREAEDVLREAGAAVLHLPDFYGPRVHTSTLQQPLEEALAGKTVNWLGAADTEREYIYVPDAMEIAARIASHDEAFGERWILPGAGPLSGESFRQIAGRELGREVRIRAAGLWTLRLVSLFNSQLRAFMRLAPDYVKPIAYDASKLRGLLGDVRVTPYVEGFGATMRWLESKS